MDFTHIDRKSKKNWAKLIQYLQVLSAKETRVVHFCTLFSETGLKLMNIEQSKFNRKKENE